MLLLYQDFDLDSNVKMPIHTFEIDVRTIRDVVAFPFNRIELNTQGKIKRINTKVQYN